VIILEDCGQKENQHKIKNEYWKSQGIEVVRLPLPTGDYCLVNEKIQDAIYRKRKRNLEVKKMDFLGCYNIAVDTKMDLSELYSNLVQSHDRFRDELLLAFNNNIKLYILVENKNDVKKIEDLVFWNNPRLFMWINNTRKIFINIQKEIYQRNNAIQFLDKRDCPIPSNDDELYKEYFKQLKEVPIDDVFNYLKSKKVSEYIRNKNCNLPDVKKIKVVKKPMDNNALIKLMQSMEEKYGVKFLFCDPADSGKIIVDLLTEKDGVNV